MENMKNMIILKDLPSNLVEEAIIILKENKKIHKYETINKKSSNQNQKEDKTGYIVKDAEMIIKSYIDNLEKKSPKFAELLLKFDTVMGLKIDEEDSKQNDIPEEIMRLIEERRIARENKDWAASDRLRDLINNKGYNIKDTKDGMEITKK